MFVALLSAMRLLRTPLALLPAVNLAALPQDPWFEVGYWIWRWKPQPGPTSLWAGPSPPRSSPSPHLLLPNGGWHCGSAVCSIHSRWGQVLTQHHPRARGKVSQTCFTTRTTGDVGLRIGPYVSPYQCRHASGVHFVSCRGHGPEVSSRKTFVTLEQASAEQKKGEVVDR